MTATDKKPPTLHNRARVPGRPVIACIADLQAIYHRRVPKMFVDYVESGSWTEDTLRSNVEDFHQIKLRQLVARDLSDRTCTTTMMGQDVAMPVALAPVGMTGMQNADGEIKAARAARAFGIPYTLSTMSVCSVEDVAEHAHHGFWFQLYVMKDRDYTSRLIARVRDAGCSVLVLTLDLQVIGQRHADIRNGLTVPMRPTIRNCLDLVSKVGWVRGMLGTRRRTFGNIVGHVDGIDSTISLMQWVSEQFDPRLDWERVAEIRREWGGPFVLKGIMDVEDAIRAHDVGADAIIVSNHGGRQLDGTISSIRALPRIVDAVGDRIELMVDSGIRSGQDVLKAMALGARGTFIGRAYIYGLGAQGEAGVSRTLEVIKGELDTSMALCGERDIKNVGRHNILLPDEFANTWRQVPARQAR